MNRNKKNLSADALPSADKVQSLVNDNFLSKASVDAVECQDK